MSASPDADSLLIVHVNIVSLQKNFDSLITFLKQFVKPVDVICISETRLNDHNLGNCNLPGYKLFHCNSKTKAGGAAIFVADRLNCQQNFEIKLIANACEDVWVEIGLVKNESLLVGTIYRHPSADFKSFKDHFIHILKSLKSSQRYVILGDFNIHYDNINKSSNITDYANHVQSVGGMQLIDKPTRISKTCDSIIDHIYTNSAHINHVTPTIICDDISDHFPICAVYKCKPKKTSRSRPYVRRMTREKIDRFLEDLYNSLYSLMENESNLNSIITLMCDLTNHHFPKKMLSRKQYKTSKSPWITSELLALIKHKNKLYDKYMKNKCPKQLAIYKKLRNKVTHEKEAAKRAYFDDLFGHASNSAETWNLINQLLHKCKPKAETPQQVIAHGKTITSPQEICNEMNRHFVEIGEKLSAKVPVTKSDLHYKQFLGKRHPSSIALQATHEHEVIEIIAGLNSHKSSGFIDIPTALIKESKFLIARPLASAFNNCLETGIYPDILKIAKVIPLHKKGPKNEVGNYRPISILSPINKIFETILHKRLINFWEKYHLFVNQQFGFRKNHSTNLALTWLYETILKQRDLDNSVCAIFMDFAKAFDTVNHRILIGKLEHYGVRGIANNLIESYLTNRKQYTVNNEQASDMLPITVGVPQGSVLGPFLFLVYINDLSNSCDSDVLMYADDAVLLCNDKSRDGLNIKSEAEMHLIESWVTANKLTINYSKTNFILFSSQTYTEKKDEFCIRARNGSNIAEQKSVKYLGVLLDNKLSWEHHTKSVVKKLTIARGIISKLRHYVPLSVLRNVYFSLVYSHLQYGISAWGNSAARYINKIQVQQNFIVKIITKSSFFKTELNPLYQKLKMLNLNNIYKLEILKFMGKYQNNSLPNCFNDFYALPSKLHSYPTRFATSDNYSMARFNKSKSQRSIRYQGPVIWNELPTEIKNSARKNKNNFIKRVKEYLRVNQ